MRYYLVAPIAAKAAILALVAITLFPVSITSAQQVKDSRVEVMICPTAGQSSLSIDEPKSDSVVGEPKVKIKGAAESLSQIDFFIDETYNDTIALGYSATEYEHVVSLNPGTHTIKLVAHDSCHQTTHTQSVVVTYAPKATPSDGSDTPTDVPAAGGSKPVNPGNPSTTTPKITEPPETSIPGLGLIPTPPTPADIARGLDLDTSFGGEVKGIWRSAAVVAGFLMVAAVPAAVGHWIMPLVSRKLLSGGSDEDTVSKVSNKHHHHMIMRLFGLALIVVPFLV